MVKPSNQPQKKRKRKSPVDKFIKQTSKIINDAAKALTKPLEPLFSKKKRLAAIKKYRTKNGRIIMSSILESLQIDATRQNDPYSFHGKTIFEIIRDLGENPHTDNNSNDLSTETPKKDPLNLEYVNDIEIVDENNKTEKVKLKQRFGFEDYLNLAQSNPSEMNLDDWIALIGQTTMRLESQIKFVLDMDINDNINFHNLLKEAEKQEVFDDEELSKLHHFRKYYRNKILHGQRKEIEDPYHIIWSAELTLAMGQDEIIEVVEA